MVNTEFNSVVNGTTAVSTAQDKQINDPVAVKKTALRDVQNENLGTKSLLPGGIKPSGGGGEGAVKVCGTKRLMPEVPTSSQAPISLPRNDLHENVMNARRRFDLELGRGKLSNVEIYALQSKKWQDAPVLASRAKNSSVKSSVMTPITAFSGPTPSFPASFGKNGGGSEAVKVPKELPRSVQLKKTDEQMRMERYNDLQMFLKKCDEDNKREYMQMLMHLSPAELSMRASELEKRAIKLALDEGYEMKRQSQLSILAKPSASNNLLQSGKS